MATIKELSETTFLEWFRATSFHDEATLDSRLLHDLGIDGQDAIRLLETYSHRFSVDLSRLNIDRFFFPEYDWMGAIFRTWLGRRDLANRRSITVRDLLEGARQGILAPAG